MWGIRTSVYGLANFVKGFKLLLLHFFEVEISGCNYGISEFKKCIASSLCISVAFSVKQWSVYVLCTSAVVSLDVAFITGVDLRQWC